MCAGRKRLGQDPESLVSDNIRRVSDCDDEMGNANIEEGNRFYFLHHKFVNREMLAVYIKSFGARIIF